VLVGRRVGFRDLLAVREELGNVDSPRNTLRLIAQIAGITLLVEVAGAVVLLVGFVRGGLGLGDGLFQAVFHAITAYCNAGFVALPGGDLTPYAGNVSVNVALMALIILGGFGFPVLVNLYHYRRRRRLTLHSKLVLVTTAALLLAGFLSVALLEWRNPDTLGESRWAHASSCPFSRESRRARPDSRPVSYPEMNETTLFLQIGLMFIGTAPTSTGGGIKVTTLALLVLVVVAQVRGQEEISAYGRRVPRQIAQKTLAVLSLSALLVVTATVTLMVSDDLALLPAIFEITSAFGTVGLTLNVTPELSPFGKLLVAGVMFLGRVGPITLVLALAARQKNRGYAYPQEDIAIG
jgi:trk system potassium uptake protein TrkH